MSVFIVGHIQAGAAKGTHDAIGIKTSAINFLTSCSLLPSPLTYTPANQNLPTSNPVAKVALSVMAKA